jgi:hypothetical protein
MLLSIIFWILAGSGVLWVLLANIIAVAWAFGVAKRLIFGKPKDTKQTE